MCDRQTFEHFLQAKFNTYEKSRNLGITYDKLVLKIAPDGEFRAGMIAHRSGNTAEIRTLFIEEKYRNQHLGSNLLEKAEIWAKNGGAKQMLLTTLSIYAPDFYEHRGYTEIFRLENTPTGGIMRIYYQKKL